MPDYLGSSIMVKIDYLLLLKKANKWSLIRLQSDLGPYCLHIFFMSTLLVMALKELRDMQE